MKAAALDAVPPAVVTEIGPLVAPAGTFVFTAVAETDAIGAVTPLNRTDVAPPSPAPLIVTVVPAAEPLGVKPLTTGWTARLPSLVVRPHEVATMIGPVVAVFGTVSETEVPDRTLNAAFTPLTFAVVRPVKPVPVTVTTEPGTACPGETASIVGAGGAPPAYAWTQLPEALLHSCCR